VTTTDPRIVLRGGPVGLEHDLIVDHPQGRS
jgi:hypothetical protein